MGLGHESGFVRHSEHSRSSYAQRRPTRAPSVAHLGRSLVRARSLSVAQSQRAQIGGPGAGILPPLRSRAPSLPPLCSFICACLRRDGRGVAAARPLLGAQGSGFAGFADRARDLTGGGLSCLLWCVGCSFPCSVLCLGLSSRRIWRAPRMSPHTCQRTTRILKTGDATGRDAGGSSTGPPVLLPVELWALPFGSYSDAGHWTQRAPDWRGATIKPERGPTTISGGARLGSCAARRVIGARFLSILLEPYPCEVSVDPPRLRAFGVSLGSWDESSEGRAPHQPTGYGFRGRYVPRDAWRPEH